MLNKHFPVQNIIDLCQNDTNMIDIKLSTGIDSISSTHSQILLIYYLLTLIYLLSVLNKCICVNIKIFVFPLFLIFCPCGWSHIRFFVYITIKVWIYWMNPEYMEWKSEYTERKLMLQRL